MAKHAPVRILSGGKAEHADPCPESTDEREPVAWHGSHKSLYLELLYSFRVKRVFDASALDEVLAMAAIESQAVYVGITWTEAHAKLLQERLVQCLWKAYLDESSPLFQVGLFLDCACARVRRMILDCA